MAAQSDSGACTECGYRHDDDRTPCSLVGCTNSVCADPGDECGTACTACGGWFCNEHWSEEDCECFLCDKCRAATERVCTTCTDTYKIPCEECGNMRFAISILQEHWPGTFEQCVACFLAAHPEAKDNSRDHISGAQHCQGGKVLVMAAEVKTVPILSVPFEILVDMALQDVAVWRVLVRSGNRPLTEYMCRADRKRQAMERFVRGGFLPNGAPHGRHVDERGTQRWYEAGDLHREGGHPAVVYIDGVEEYYEHDELHREGDQPAIVTPDGLRKWYNKGELHRGDNRPAVVWPGGAKAWYSEGMWYDPKQFTELQRPVKRRRRDNL